MLCHSNLVVFTSWQLALLMTFSKFKNQLSVLSPALPTILILNLSLKKLQILPLPDLILFNKLQFMQSFNQNFLPSSVNDTWVKNSIRNIGENDIQLGNFDQLCLTHVNLTSLDLFPLYNFPKLWQDFPNEQNKIISKPNLTRNSRIFFLTISR